jgi:hypothetical protein
MAKDKKLKNLMEHWGSGQVATTQWLREMGISITLTQRYLKSEWIESIGRGAYKRTKDPVRWYGALASIQQQLGKHIHPGGPTALSLMGRSHYIRQGGDRIFLFHPHDEKLPKWYLDYNWDQKIEPVATSVFPGATGIKPLEYQGFEINTASPERAILECLYLAPRRFDLLECYQLLESLRTLRPDIMQTLLENCSSIRVKRLFLYMAQKASLPVLDHMQLNAVDLGVGDRAIVKNGVYNSAYKISIPAELVNYA